MPTLALLTAAALVQRDADGTPPRARGNRHGDGSIRALIGVCSRFGQNRTLRTPNPF